MIDNTFAAVMLASSLACLVTTMGIFVISKYEAWGRANIVYFMSFAAGVLISVSFMHIIPKSLQMNVTSPLFLLGGFLALYLLNRFLNLYICNQYQRQAYASGIIPMVCIGIHSLLDGVIYSVTFNVSIFTGTLAALGMVLHEFPEGIVTFLLLARGGISKEKAAVFAFLAAAISTPLGTLVSYPFINRITQPALGIWLAFSAGALVYVGASHLLPEVEKVNKRYSVISLAVGVLASVTASSINIEAYSANLWGRTIKTLYHLKRSDATGFIEVMRGLDSRIGVSLFPFEALPEALILAKLGQLDQPNALFAIA